MSDWETIQLGKILKLSDEKSITQDQFPVLTSSRSGLFLQSDYFKKIVASKNNLGYKVIRNGQFTYRAMSDDGYFKFNRLVNQTAGIISPAYEVFEVNKSVANASFIDYLLDSELMSSQIYFSAQGGTRLALRFDALAKFIVKLPPLNEQKKIAEVLSVIDNLRNQLILKIQSLYFLRKALFQRISSISFESEKVKFGEIIEEIRSGWSPICLPHERVGNSPGVLKTSAITWDGYTPSENKAVPKSLKVKNQALVQEQDILCTRKGPMGRVGVVCYVEKTPLNLMLPDTAFRIRISNHLNAKFIALILSTDAVQNVWHKKKIGLAEAQVNINHGIIKETEIPIPSSQIQYEIVEQMSLNMNLINNLKNQVESLIQLKRGVSSDLLSGRKRVSN